MEQEHIDLIGDMQNAGMKIMMELDRALWDPRHLLQDNVQWEPYKFIRCEPDEMRIAQDEKRSTWYIAVRVYADTDNETWICHMTICRGQRKRTDDGMTDEQWSQWCSDMQRIVERFGEYKDDWLPTVYPNGRVTLQLPPTSPLHEILHNMFVETRRMFWYADWTRRDEFHLTVDRVLRVMPRVRQ